MLRFEAGPLVAIEWSGDDPGKKARQEAERAWPAFATPEAAAAAVARTALYRLQAEGYYTARVEPHAASAEGRVDVRLQRDARAEGASVVVVFEGNQALDDAALARGAAEARQPRVLRSARPAQRADRERRAAGLRRHRPPARAQLAAPRTAFDPATGRLTVTIDVRERAASTVAGIELPAELAPETAPLPALRLVRGEPFDLGAYVADRDAIGEWYRAQGWIDAQVGAVDRARVGRASRVRYLVDRRAEAACRLGPGRRDRQDEQQPDPPVADAARGRPREARGALREP